MYFGHHPQKNGSQGLQELSANEMRTLLHSIGVDESGDRSILYSKINDAIENGMLIVTDKINLPDKIPQLRDRFIQPFPTMFGLNETMTPTEEFRAFTKSDEIQQTL